MSDPQAMSIEDLDLPVGTYNRLKRGGIRFFTSLLSYYDDELERYFRLTPRDVDIVQDKLLLLGLSIKI